MDEGQFMDLEFNKKKSKKERKMKTERKSFILNTNDGKR